MSEKSMDATIKELRRNAALRNTDNAELHELKGADIGTNALLKNGKKERKRVSVASAVIPPEKRREITKAIIKSLLLDELTQGEALVHLRSDILGLKQADYAKMVKVSRKTISEIENDKGGQSVDVLNRVFKPFGLHMGLIP
ncbi:MAG: helix-turn-helix domain-containing protein, partial [Alteromonadales bacterium]|nr:helix-turn-helix domain-containing protein [Alteromonadales bacterium]